MPMELQGMTHINLIMMEVITPTAALSASLYTSRIYEILHFCMMKIELIMLVLLDLTMLFSPNYNWVTPRYLAIDQGTIVLMIENYRTGLLWNLFMQAPEKMGLKH
jgi:hypothetical protein